MNATMLNAVTQEVLFYITAGLCTLVAILVSYHWLLRKPTKTAGGEKEDAKKRGTGKEDAKKRSTGEEDAKKRSTGEEDTEETVEEDQQKVPAGCPFGFGTTVPTDEPQEPQQHGSLDDLLINSSDIQPLSEEEKWKLKDNGAGNVDEPVEDSEILDHRKVKELEDEVVKSMSEQQLDDERKARREQLEAIFNLMEDNKERFGMSSVDDVQNQYKLYV